MNNTLSVVLLVVLCLMTGCADSSRSRRVIEMSPGLDFADAQRLANSRCKKLDARAARMVKEEPNYIFECVESESAADTVPKLEVPIIGHGPLD